MRPIVETYQTRPEDFQPSPLQLDAYRRKLLSQKTIPAKPPGGKNPHKRRAHEARRAEIEDAKKSLTAECADLAAQCKRLRKRAAYSAQGFSWHARIVDSETNETIYDSPLAWKDRFHADRHGRRLIERHAKTGSWTDRTGITVDVGSSL